jgi:uncharacterized coiled-coil protein SlyX
MNNTTQLEIKFSYLEKFVSELNSVIIEQAEEISSLKKELEKLKIQIETLSDNDDQIVHEKPPHY